MTIIAAIDQGTTGSTVMLLSEELRTLAKHNVEFRQIFPQPGWVEHDPVDIWDSVQSAFQQVVVTAGITAKDITTIGITNQRETTVVWNKKTGQPVGNAIVWQDRRTADQCQSLREAGHLSPVQKRTGLVLDPYFSATKLAWMLDQSSEVRTAALAGDLAFGTMDSFLVWKLTGGAAHVTDVSNASRTLLFDIRAMQWSPELLELFQVPAAMLPTVCTNAEVYGTTKDAGIIPDGISISGMAGDQQAALFGQTCFSEGQAKCTYGTGSFLLMNTGSKIVASKDGLLTTVAWKLGDETQYALEGSAFVAGAAIQWLRDGLGIVSSAADIEALARQVPDSDGVCFVPALTGLGAPYWEPNARGAITGLTRGTTKAHIARAALDGIALQNADILRAMQQSAGSALTSLRVDGGASAQQSFDAIAGKHIGDHDYSSASYRDDSVGCCHACWVGRGNI